MPEQVPPAVKEERHEKLLSVINELAAKHYSKMTGQLVEILVEGPSKRPERLLGRTRCNKIVLFEGSARQVGELINVKVTRAGSFTLYGDPMIQG
jgi:tRNA-2-methylthio-N6-dimethylallyladenosine synthase